MSSHHFVREDQEPALVIADATAVPITIVQQLLEWSPTVIVLDKALATALSWGIKIDVVICREEKVKSNLELLAGQAPVKLLSHQPHENPLVTVFYFLMARKQQTVNVVGVAPDALEEFVQQLDIVTFHNERRWSFARNGKFEKWLTAGTTIVTIGESTKTEGLDNRGVAIKDGLVRVESDDKFWVGENY